MGQVKKKLPQPQSAVLAAPYNATAVTGNTGLAINLTPGKWLVIATVRFAVSAGRGIIVKLRNTTAGADVSNEVLTVYSAGVDLQATNDFTAIVTIAANATVALFARGIIGSGTEQINTDANGGTTLNAVPLS